MMTELKETYPSQTKIFLVSIKDHNGVDENSVSKKNQESTISIWVSHITFEKINEGCYISYRLI